MKKNNRGLVEKYISKRNFIDNHSIKPITIDSDQTTNRLATKQFVNSNKYIILSYLNSNVFSKMSEHIKNIDDVNIKKSVLRFINIFQSNLISLHSTSENQHYLPPLSMNLEKDAAIIEWMFKDFRITFVFDINEDNSGWFLVKNTKSINIDEFGPLTKLDYDYTISSLIKYAIRNS